MAKLERHFDPSFAAEITDSDSEPCEATLKEIADAIERIYRVSVLHATEKTAKLNDMEITDFGDRIFICPQSDTEGDFGLTLYKEHSEKRVLEDSLGEYTYYAPEKEKQEVHIRICPSELSRRFEDTDALRAMRAELAASGEEIIAASKAASSSEDFAERVAEVAPELIEAAEARDSKRVEAEAFEEITGMDKVTEEGAQKLLEALGVIEQYLA